MSDQLPIWIQKRYNTLLEKFGDRLFSKKEAEDYLERNDVSVRNLNEVFIYLSKGGYLKSIGKGKNTKYQLIKINEKKLTTKDVLIHSLKSAADLLRGHDYRMLLLFLFFKELSDKWDNEIKKLVEEKKFSLEDAYDVANSTPGLFRLYDEENKKLYTWNEVTKDKIHIVDRFSEAFSKLEEMNPKKLKGLKTLVATFNLKGFLRESERLTLINLVNIFDRLDFTKVDYDTLGSAYEWVLYYFAKDKAKKGEIYTPREVIDLMVRILDIKLNSTILDPACGSAAMLIRSFEYVKNNNENPNTLKLIGQEKVEEIAVIGRLNLVVHGIENFNIFVGDSLSHPYFGSADYVLANPPWNYDYLIRNDNLAKTIYKYGVTPKQSADWLWVQLMLHFSKKKVAVVLDSGSLFRGGKEKAIRKAIVEDDLIDTIILLPSKLFYNTGAPGIILILDHNKPKSRKNKILFIDASEEYEKHPEVKKLNRLGEKNISKIVEIYRKFKDIKGFSRVASLEEIKEKDYSLNIPLYVEKMDEEEDILIEEEWKELKKIDSEIARDEEKINEFMKVIK